MHPFPHRSGGFASILVLLIVVTIITVILVRTDLFSGTDGGKSVIEEQQESVDDARAVKDMLEARDRQQTQVEE